MCFLSTFLCPFCSITGTNIIFVRYFFVSSWVRSCGNSFCHLDAELSMVLFDSSFFFRSPLIMFWLVTVIFFFFSGSIAAFVIDDFGSDPRLVFCVSCRVLFRVAMTSFINAIAIVCNQ